MSLTKEEFVQRLQKVHDSNDDDTSLQSLREDAIATENLYRELFARKRESWEIPEIDDPYLFLLDVFDHSSLMIKAPTTDSIPRCCPLAERWTPGSPTTVPSMEEFNVSWECFTEGLLRFLDWNNVFAAGGSVAGCLAPLPHEIASASFAATRVQRRKYFHDTFLPSSDIDLFLYGLNEEQAAAKLLEIFDAVQAASPYEIRAFRTAHAISLVSRYPFRHVQIVLRLYNSPSEILMGFDVDACAAGFNGSKVYVCPRTALAIVTQTNTVDMSRRSPSYEIRLAKYAERGYEVLVPHLDRDRVDPFLYERRFDQVKGLSRLLLLERLKTPEQRLRYRLQGQLKSANEWTIQRRIRKAAGDVRNIARMEGGEGIIPDVTGPEVSDYSTLFLPWGPNWPADKLERLTKKKDKLINKLEFLPNGQVIKSRRPYKIHVCAVGTMEEVIENPFPNDPPIPEDVPPESLETSVRGRVSWLVDNPGRQRIGSFHPITADDWHEGAYISSQTEELIAAAIANDPQRVQAALNDGAQLSARDFLGRTALHVAVVSGADAVCRVLLGHADANMSFLKAKLPDGRNALHIASMRQEVELLDMILEKRQELFVALQKEGAPALAEILDIDGSDWEVKLNPLHYAILLGNFDAAKCLIRHGADVQKVAVQKDANESFSCFGLLALYSSECGNMLKLAKVEKMIHLLVENGASPAQIDTNGATAWHRFASSYKSSSLEVLKVTLHSQAKDGEKPKGLDIVDNAMQTPLSVAARCGNALAVSIFLEAGATPSFDRETWEVLMQRKMEHSPRRYGYYESDIQSCVRVPFFLAVRCLSPNTVSAFLSLHPSLANAEIFMAKLSFQRSFGGCEVEGDNELTLRPLDYLNALEMSHDNEGRHRGRHISNRGVATQRVKYLLQQAEELAGDPDLSSYRRLALKFVVYQLKSRVKASEMSLITPDPSPEELKEKADREERTKLCIQILKSHEGKALLRFKEPHRESGPSDSSTSDGTKLMEPWELMNNCPPAPSQYIRVHLHGKQAVFSSQRDSYRRLFEQIVDGHDPSEITSFAESMKLSVFDSLGNTVLSLAILHKRPTLFKSLAQLATTQFINHLEYERGIRQSEDDIRKSDLKEADNLLKDQLRRLNNLDIADGTEPTGANLTPTPDLMRQRLDLANAEACRQGNQSDSADIESNVPLDQMLTFRSIVSLEELPKLESVLEAITSWSPSEDIKESGGQPIRVNVFETAVLSGDVALFLELQKTAFEYCKKPMAEVASENEEASDPSHSDEDDDSIADTTSSSRKAGLAADCRRTASELREAVYGSGNPDLGGMTLIEMVITLDDLPMLRALIPFAREHLIPRAAVAAWKTHCDATEHPGYLWSRPQPTLIQLALSFKARTIIDAFFQNDLASELYTWILDEELEARQLRSKLRDNSVTTTALLKSPSLCLRWILAKLVETNLAEICDRLCSVEAPDAVGRTALYYAQGTEIQDTLTAASSSPDAPFIDSVTTDGSISALVAAACGAQFDRLEGLINGGANLSLNVGPKHWNVIHHIISVRPQKSKSKSADKKDAENDDPWLTSRMLIDTVLRAADESVTEACLLPAKAEHTPLMLAIQRGVDTDTLSFLLEKYGGLAGIAIERLDNELNTVLHYAVTDDLAHTKTDSVNMLIQHSKVSCTTQANSENANGLTPGELALDSVASPWSRSRSNRMDRFAGRPGQTRAPMVSNDPLDSRVLLGALAQISSSRAAVSFQDVKTAKEIAAKALKEMESAARMVGSNWAHEKAFPRVTSDLRWTGEWNGWFYRYN